VVALFEQIRQKFGENKAKIHVFSDNGGYFRTEKVKAAAGQLNIEQHFIPTYSPNLNPIERGWKVQNKYVRNNIFFKSPTDFRAALRNFAEKIWPEICNTLTTWVNDNLGVIAQEPAA
jgi:transposase